jgi:D-alanyl-D-alanine carboxypeptidase (penicillin-binding protein 5/6)
MDFPELQQLAERSRFRREAGVALLIASLVLAFFTFFPRQTASTGDQTAVATSTAPDSYANVPITAKAAIVYDLTTGKVLYAKNADAQLPLASLTKLLTVYAAYTELSPTTPVTIPADATRLDLPRAFNAGQTFALDDLARLTLTASLNDGAAAIASATAARENTNESNMLASAASGLDLAQTFAVNGSGLDVSKSLSGGYGSAFDLARLAGALVKIAPQVAIATTDAIAKAVSAGGTAFSVKNTDPVVGNIPRLLLSKTGFTDLAGGNLALVFDAAILHPIAVVVLGSSKTDRFTDATALVAATLAHFAERVSL